MKKIFLSAIAILFVFNISFAQNKIEPELQSALENKNEEKISINIIFKSQLDVSELRQRTDNSISKEIKRKNVIKELKNFSEETQQEVLSIIKTEESKGEVSNIVCHWLSNSITCDASKEVIEKLSKHDDILLIGYNCDRDALLGEYGQKTTDYKHNRTAETEVTENVTRINADDVWEMGYTGEGVLVAILDTGVDYEHPDLADHLWDGGEQYPNHGYNSYDGSNVTMDTRGHGTHCAGTICGDGTAGKQTGVAPNVTLMCIKALSDEGSANANSICSGMEFAVEHGAEVLSMSLGIANSSIADRTMIRQTCVNVLEAGVIASVAAGNEGTYLKDHPIPNNIRVPGSCPAPWIHPDQEENAGTTSCVVSVGAVDKNDKVAGISSRGPVTWQETSFGDYPYDPGIGLIRPDICAPGIDIVSLDFSTNEYVKMSGTSMAAPCVAGVMCLMLSKNPDLTPAEISMILETSSMKIGDKKNNETGSGRVDALATINAINMGNLIFKDFTFNDENANNRINPNEEITLNVSFENISDENYNNIKAVLKCDNEWINITKSETEIANITAKEAINIDEAFIFKVDEAAESKTKLFFDVEFYENDLLISKTRFDATIYGNTIKYAAMEIVSDENANGILEAGENGKMNITLNNEGNEIALGLTATLKSESDLIIIDEAEVILTNDIAPESSASALFSVNLSENAGNDFNIPLKLEIKDKFDRVSSFNINYKNSCGITYTLKDEYGDGWNGAKIIANYHNPDGIETESYTITNGYTETFNKTLQSGTLVKLEWKKGGVDTECSYSIHYDNGVEIFSGKGKQDGEFFQWNYDCSCQNMIIETCDNVENFNIEVGNHSVTLKWETPNNSEALSYEIYRETELIATTEDLSYTDENLSSGTYRYNVRPVFENCYGLTLTKEIVFTVDVNEISTLDVTIYPNPARERIKLSAISCQPSMIKVYNYLGMLMDEIEVDSDEMEINLSDYNSGIYFINIESANGTAVKKIVKY